MINLDLITHYVEIFNCPSRLPFAFFQPAAGGVEAKDAQGLGRLLNCTSEWLLMHTDVLGQTHSDGKFGKGNVC